MHWNVRHLSALCLLIACSDAQPTTEPSDDSSQDDVVETDNASAVSDVTLASEARIWHRRDAGAVVHDASVPVAHDASVPVVHDASVPVAHDAGSPPVVADAGASGEQALAQHCVDSINAYRATLNLPPYARAASKESCVDGEAAADALSNTAHSAFGSCQEWAQNECPGWPSKDETKSLDGCLAQVWAEGPGDFNAGHGHYINMTSTTYKSVACGIHDLGNGKFWATQDFF